MMPLPYEITNRHSGAFGPAVQPITLDLPDLATMTKCVAAGKIQAIVMFANTHRESLPMVLTVMQQDVSFIPDGLSFLPYLTTPTGDKQ